MKELLRRKDGWNSLVSWNTRHRLIGSGKRFMSHIHVTHDTDLLAHVYFSAADWLLLLISLSCTLPDLKR